MNCSKITITSLATALVAMAAYPSANNSARTSPTERSDDRGRTVFIEKGCADCHAVYGRGVGDTEPKGGPDLGKKEIYGTNLELAATMWNHFPKMLRKFRRTGRQFPSFTENEVEEIISFLSYIRYQGQPGNERVGRKLLERKKCKVCHTFGGEGGNVGPDITKSEDYLSPLAFAAAMWNHGPEMRELFEANDIGRPEFKGHEIVDLASAVRSFMRPNRVPVGSFEPGDAEVGEEVVSQMRCNHCHAQNEAVWPDAVDFAKMELSASVTEIAGNMWNHGPEMWDRMNETNIAFPRLQSGEMADIIAYIYELGLSDPPGDAESGADLVAEKGCISCHAESSGGAGLGPDFSDLNELASPLSMIAQMWNHVEDMDEAVRENRKKWPKFGGEELADIYTYLQQVSGSTEIQ